MRIRRLGCPSLTVVVHRLLPGFAKPENASALRDELERFRPGATKMFDKLSRHGPAADLQQATRTRRSSPELRL
jgi:hypothetical protein